jgi:hypothetical protein
VEDSTEKRKLNAIVGAALKALVESGAGDEFVGAFAATHRTKVASILGAAEPPADSPDLVAVIAQAVGVAFEQAGIGKRKGGSSRRINVLVGGRRTSLTVNPALMDRLIQIEGPRKAKLVIQDLANTAPTDVKNRSGWVEERLTSVLSLTSQPEPSSPRH